MRDRVTIEIDCIAGVVSVSGDQLSTFGIGGQIQTTKAFLIAQLLTPYIREFMNLSRADLMARHLLSVEGHDG